MYEFFRGGPVSSPCLFPSGNVIIEEIMEKYALLPEEQDFQGMERRKGEGHELNVGSLYRR